MTSSVFRKDISLLLLPFSNSNLSNFIFSPTLKHAYNSLHEKFLCFSCDSGFPQSHFLFYSYKRGIYEGTGVQQGEPCRAHLACRNAEITRCVTLLLPLNNVQAFPWHEDYVTSNVCSIIVPRTQVFVTKRVQPILLMYINYFTTLQQFPVCIILPSSIL